MIDILSKRSSIELLMIVIGLIRNSAKPNIYGTEDSKKTNN